MESGTPLQGSGITTVPVDRAAIPLTCGRFLYLLAEPSDRWRDETIASMSPDKALILGLCLDSRVAATHDVARMVVEALRRAGHVLPPFSEDLQLVITELIANAHLHGNLRDIPPRDAPDAYFQRGISVSVARENAQIRLVVSNQSPETVDSEQRRRTKEQLTVRGDPAGGLGLKIVEGMGGRIVHSEDLSRWTVTFPLP